MSVSSVDVILDRIESASEKSPIAVLKMKYKCGKLNAVFASTVTTKNQIEQNHPDLIGVFYKGMDKSKVKRELLLAA